MTINNQNRAAWIKLSYYLGTFIYLATIVLLVYLNLSNIYTIIGAITAVFISIVVFSFKLNLNYIIYQESDQFLIFRYYPLHPFHDNFKSIEIPKKNFAHFDLQKRFFGFRSEIVLYQQVERGMAKYPPISLTSLSKDDKTKLISSLKRYSKAKK